MTTGLRYLMPVLAAALAAGGCKASPPYEQPLTPVTVAGVESSSTGTTVRYSATVKPSLEVTLAFKVAGYVDDILTRPGDRGRVRDVQEGDRVAKGAALARVRQSDYQQRVAQIKAGVAEATAAYDNARLDYDRAARLFAKQSLTKPELDGAKARLDATAAKVEGARAGLGEAQLVLGDAVLRAPIDGVVLERSIERGTLVSPGTKAFVLADTSSVKVVFGVPDVVVRQLRIGRPQRLAFEALKGETFEGRITSIAPAPDPVSRVYQIEITVPNAQDKLAVGFIASLQLADQPGETVVTVPLEAIVKPGTGAAEYGVFVVDGPADAKTAKFHPVKLGAVVGNAITVTGGLAVKQLVIVRGATLVADGQRVRVLP
jgi:multidrug efflux system membrane fusion protein